MKRLLAAFAVILLSACSTTQHQPPISGPGWHTTQWNNGVTVTSTANGFKFNFPDSNGNVNAIEKDQGPLTSGKTITLKFKITVVSGNPQFKSLDTNPGLPPNFRIMLQRKGDDYSGSGEMQHYRWWATGTLCQNLQPVANGIYSVKITTTNFSNVWGKIATQFPAEFAACLANLEHLQIVFGGGTSFSHGVNVIGGVVQFELIGITIS